MRTHYPRTPHLPWSPGATRDDVRVADLAGFTGREVVVTEKLDGENTTLYADGLHARSLDSAHHPSRAWVKALHGRIGPHIPEGWRVCGENLYARHSLPYEDLDGYFYGFSVWDELHWCPGWDFTVDFLRKLGIPTPRVLWRGVFDERALRRLTVDTARQEGYVVRTADGFMAGRLRAARGQMGAAGARADRYALDAHRGDPQPARAPRRALGRTLRGRARRRGAARRRRPGGRGRGGRSGGGRGGRGAAR